MREGEERRDEGGEIGDRWGGGEGVRVGERKRDIDRFNRFKDTNCIRFVHHKMHFGWPTRRPHKLNCGMSLRERREGRGRKREEGEEREEREEKAEGERRGEEGERERGGWNIHQLINSQ